MFRSASLRQRIEHAELIATPEWTVVLIGSKPQYSLELPHGVSVGAVCSSFLICLPVCCESRTNCRNLAILTLGANDHWQ